MRLLTEQTSWLHETPLVSADFFPIDSKTYPWTFRGPPPSWLKIPENKGLFRPQRSENETFSFD